MNLSELSIRRPVMTTLLMAALVVFGIIGYRALPVSELPRVDFPIILVQANLAGASPETMASAVATPLEGQFATIAGLDSITSVSSQGSSAITLQFALDRDIDAAAQDVQSALAASQKQLPRDMTTPPSFRKINPGDAPILYIAMSSPTLSMAELDDYAERQLAQRLSTVRGVALVGVLGPQKYAVRVQVNPQKLATLGIGIDEVETAIAQANVNLPTGTLDGRSQSISLRATGQLDSAAGYRPLVVAYRNGAPVRVQDVGTAIDSVENNKIATWYNGERAIILTVQRQPGANTIETTNAIFDILPSFLAKLPASIKMQVQYDRSVSIRASVNDVQFTLLLAGLLVLLVIFLFLRNLSATVIPSLALPISVIGTFAIMYVMDFSLDNLSLLALTLAVGFVVDDAIVMLENIVRHIEGGESPWDAAFKGSKEIGFTIVSMTLSLIAVFIPLLFMKGIVGRLLHEFAVTICAAILVSGFVSLTLTPMLCSRFVGAHDPNKQHGRLYLACERFFERLHAYYERTLRLSLKHHRVVFLIFLATIVLTAWLLASISKDFLPGTDTGQLLVTVDGPQDASFDFMVRHRNQLSEVLAEDPNVDSYNIAIGAGGFRPSANQASMFIKLKDPSKRKLSADQVLQELRPKFAQVPGVRVSIQNPPSIRIGGQLTPAEYQYTLQDADLDELYQWTDTLVDRLSHTKGFQDVTSNLNVASPSLVLNLQRDKIASLGLSASQVEVALGSAFGAKQVSTIYTATNQNQVILEVEPQFQGDPASLSSLYVRSTSGKLISLDTVASVTSKAQALTINHLGQLPSETISFNLAPGVSLGDAVTSIKALTNELHPPVSLSASLQGAAQAFESSLTGLGLLLIVAVLVVYIVLGILYESFVHPLTILSGLPSAGVGALLTLKLFHVPLSLYAFVGIIMLIGIVKKNAIMMIDFALEKQRGAGIAPADAIFDACLVRFRPIMMTTMAALMGALPIAIGFGAGSEARRPLGLAVVGGLLVSQVLTLYITPVIYLYLDKIASRLRQQPGGKPPEHALPTASAD